MITGMHTVMYAQDAEQARAFLRDVLGFRSVDAGQGWLIFALPPMELGVHPIEPDASENAGRGNRGAKAAARSAQTAAADKDADACGGHGRHPRCDLYLLCDDVQRTVSELERKGVEFTSPVMDRGWGLVTTFKVPGAGAIGLYQPKHPTAIQAG